MSVFNFRRARLGAVALAASAAFAMAASAPAHAVIVDTDRPLISTQELDFGRNWLLGAPLNGGFLDWDVSGGIVTVSLEGNLYINNASGTCARMRIETYDANHVLQTSANGATRCATNGSLHTFNPNFSAPGDPDIEHAHVALQVQTAGGGYLDVEELGFYMN